MILINETVCSILGDCDSNAIRVSVCVHRDQLVCIGIAHILVRLSSRCQCFEILRSDTKIRISEQNIIDILDLSRSILLLLQQRLEISA